MAEDQAARSLDEMSHEEETQAFLAKRQAAAKPKPTIQNAIPVRRKKFCPPSADQLLFTSVAVSILVAMVMVSRQEEHSSTRLFSKDLLAKFNGQRNAPMYLAILGQVFDVSKGKNFYGGGGGYSFFVGRDASRAFVTGDFQRDLTDNVHGLSNEQYASLIEWTNFYHKEYTFKGRLIGRFYDRHGNRTALLQMVTAGALSAKTNDELRRESEARYPKCDIRWTDVEGGWVSCNEENLRPRKIFFQLPGGKPAQRCACMDGIGWSDVRQVYPNCSPEAQACQVSPPPS